MRRNGSRRIGAKLQATAEVTGISPRVAKGTNTTSNTVPLPYKILVEDGERIMRFDNSVRCFTCIRLGEQSCQLFVKLLDNDQASVHCGVKRCEESVVKCRVICEKHRVDVSRKKLKGADLKAMAEEIRTC